MGTWNWIWTSYLLRRFFSQCASLVTWQYPPSVGVNSGNTPQQGTDTPAPWTRAHNDVSRPDGLRTGKSRGQHLENVSPRFANSLFIIRVNRPKYQPSLFRFGLLLPIWCFSCLRKLIIRSLLRSEDDYDVKQHKKWLIIQENHTKKLTETLALIGHWVAHWLDFQWLFREISPHFPPTPPPPPTPKPNKSLFGLLSRPFFPRPDHKESRKSSLRGAEGNKRVSSFVGVLSKSRGLLPVLRFREPSGSNTQTVNGFLHRSAGLASHKN